MKNLNILSLALVSALLSSAANASNLSFLKEDSPYVVHGDKAMYLYVGKFDSLKFRGEEKKIGSKYDCSLRLEVKNIQNEPQIIGVAGLDFNFTNITDKEYLSVSPKKDNTVDVIYKLNFLRKSTYTLQLDKANKLTSFVLNNDDAPVGAWLLDGWTGDFVQNCTDLKNVSDLSQISNVWDGKWILEHKEKFLRGYQP